MLDGRVGRDIFFYSVRLSPEEDTPKDLRPFAKEHGAGPGWTFLTGKPEDILLLRHSLGFFYDNPKEDADRNNHSGMILIGTEPGCVAKTDLRRDEIESGSRLCGYTEKALDELRLPYRISSV